MKALTKILGLAVAALIVVALGFYFIEVYAPSPANPTLSAAIQQDSIPIGSMTREFLNTYLATSLRILRWSLCFMARRWMLSRCVSGLARIRPAGGSAWLCGRLPR